MTAQRLTWIALAAATIGLIAHALVFNFINDDAFISFRYADNLVRHGALVYNPGERVEGYTNFLWTLMMAGVIGLGLDPVAWSKGLGIAFGAATLWVVGLSMRREVGGGAQGALAAALLAAAPAYACWSTGGLETQLFTFTATFATTSYLEGKPRRSGVLFALAAMSRPEGMLFFGLVGLHRIGEMIMERRWRPTREDWAWGLSFAALFLPYYAWRFWYYGWPFPNTYYVKTGASGFWRPGLRYFASWVQDHLIWALPALLLIRPRRVDRRLTLSLLIAVAVSAHVIRVGGDFMALHRFFVPIMPLLAILAAEGLLALWRALSSKGVGAWRLSLAALTLSAGLGFHIVEVDREALKVGSKGGVDSIGWLNQFAIQCTAIGRWLGAHAEPDAALATTAAGTIPYYARRYTVDILALNDEWLAHNLPAHGSRPGHTKSAPLDYLLKKDIDYMIYHPHISARRPYKGPEERRVWAARGYRWEAHQIPGLEPPFWGVWRRQEGGAR
ncbi:hypothetical protein KKF91_02855 [Myxococcota bacterium]|nr:hypothetical protein [Myxococcota bacterium]MBU1429479.1 hypothetical protein [Myxococcota bacterium]MBU1896145.1 hypothetical protein [Myxococcota bacterium]